MSFCISDLTPAQARDQAEAIFRHYSAKSPDDVLNTRQRLLLLAQRSGDQGLVVDALLWNHQTLLFLDRDADAQAVRDEARSIAESLGDPALVAVADLCDAQACWSSGLYVEAVAKIRRALPAFATHRDPDQMRGRAYRVLCDVYKSLSLWEQAIDCAAVARDIAASRDDEYSTVRALYDELYSRLSRAEIRYAHAPAMPADDDDLGRVEAATRAFLAAFDPAHVSEAVKYHAVAFKEMLFQVLMLTQRRSEALAMWKAHERIERRYGEPLDEAEVAYHLEGPRRTLDILLPVINVPGVLGPINRVRAWRIISNAHAELGNHQAALEALRELMKLELSQSQTNAKTQAALLGLELEAEREKLLAQRALIHAGKLAAVGQLASSMAHEVSQPAAALMLLAADARQAVQSQRLEVLDEMLGDIEAQAQRLSRLVNRMKEFSRDDPLHMQVLGLPEVLEEGCRLCRPIIEAAKVRCVVDTPALRIHADKERLMLTLVNLVNNAVDAMRGQTEPPPELRIEAAMRDDSTLQVCLSVIDNGPGLSKEAQAHLSQPFFTTKSSGLGLGLTITREALAGMGARLEARNEKGRGARFSVLLTGDKGA
jgi:signal transduction histidine kinase